MNIELKEIKYKSLVNTVTEKLEELILLGTLKSNERLLETTLSENFNVSRASIREALRILETSGFVTNIPRKGFYVAEITPEEAEETFIIRADLESLATYFAVKKQASNVLDELKRLHGQMIEMAAASDIVAFRLSNREFHEVLSDASGNKLLSHMVRNYIKQTRRYRITYHNTPNRLKRANLSHANLIELFERNEPEKARKFRKRTLLKNAKILVKKIESMRQV